MTNYEAIRILNSLHSRQEHVLEAIDMAKSALAFNWKNGGYWIDATGDYSDAECSLCGEMFCVTDESNANEEHFEEFKDTYRFCPCCGARMDAEGAP